MSAYTKKKKRRSTKPRKPATLKTWLIPRLRRISRFWPEANEAMKLAWRFPGHYECAHCKGIFHVSNVQRDHILPVINVKGFSNWHETVTRLFCDRSGYQVLCVTCHGTKTAIEAEERSLHNGS